MLLVIIVNCYVPPSYFYEINNYTCTVKVFEYHQFIFMILVITLRRSVSWTYINDDPVLLPPQLATLPAWSVWALVVTTVSPVLSPVRFFSRGSVWMTADPSTMSKRTGVQVCLLHTTSFCGFIGEKSMIFWKELIVPWYMYWKIKTI